MDEMSAMCHDVQEQVYYDMLNEINKIELRILKNFIDMMPNTYRKRNVNWVIVRDILMTRTSTMGSTSCRNKCMELDIKPYEYEL